MSSGLGLGLHSQYILNWSAAGGEGGQAASRSQDAPILVMWKNKDLSPLGPSSLPRADQQDVDGTSSPSGLSGRLMGVGAPPGLKAPRFLAPSPRTHPKAPGQVQGLGAQQLWGTGRTGFPGTGRASGAEYQASGAPSCYRPLPSRSSFPT